MKKKSIVTLLVCLFFVFNSEGQLNFKQINSSELDVLLPSQSFQDEYLAYSSITQTGNYNRAILSQNKERNSLSLPNSTNSFQQGDFNFVDIIQKGNENVLFSFQLGYLIYVLTDENNDIQNSDIQLQNLLSFINVIPNSHFTDGFRNSLISAQEGNSNKILAIQQGDNNYVSAEQLGNENYLVVKQVGSYNKVENFKQNTINGKSDVISQIGDNNTFNTFNESNSEIYGNIYSQVGTNLSITQYNNTLSPLGGIEVNQTGHDMSIVIDQSFFSFPMK